MAVSTTITVSGAKETINALKKIDPQLAKDFRTQANEIAQPAINAALGALDTIDITFTGGVYSVATS